MIYLLFACFCVFFFFLWKQAHKIGRHNGVLFPFCQLRRDVMWLLRQHYTDELVLSAQEIGALKQLSEILDKTIGNYNQHKTEMFNLRKVIAYIKKYPRVLREVEPVELPDNRKIRKFYAQFAVLLAKAFLAYTPLIRYEIVWVLLTHIWQILARKTTLRVRQEAISIAQQIRSGAQKRVAG